MKRPALLIGFSALVFSAVAWSSSGAGSYAERQALADRLYDRGDYSQALDEYEYLARRGDRFSQYRLSVMHLLSQGTDQDPADAFAWAVLAAQGGQDDLVDYARTIASLMPEDQTRRAQRRADYFLRRWGDRELARQAVDGARRELRNCTGSRLGQRCEEVYSMQMPRFWATWAGPGQATGLPGNGRGDGPQYHRGSGTISTGDKAGGQVLNTRYYLDLRASIRAVESYMAETSTRVTLGPMELLEIEENDIP